jgi:hypothetical protein
MVPQIHPEPAHDALEWVEVAPVRVALDLPPHHHAVIGPVASG